MKFVVLTWDRITSSNEFHCLAAKYRHDLFLLYLLSELHVVYNVYYFIN